LPSGLIALLDDVSMIAKLASASTATQSVSVK
jgi:hypothetical protein